MYKYKHFQTNRAVHLPDADLTVSEVDTGKVMLIPILTDNRVITLPAVEAGLRYRFIASPTGAASTALGFTATLTPAPAANIVNGVLTVNNGGGPPLVAGVISKAGAANCVLTATAVKGDYIEIYSDGTYWFVSGASRISNGLS